MRRNKSSNVIYANFRFGGKTFRHSLETEDKLVARNTLTNFRQKLESGEFDPESHTTVKEIAPKFLESIANMSESFQTRATGHMKFFVEEFPDKNPRRIRPMEIDEWLNDLREEREFGEDSYNKYVATFKDFYAFLIKNHFATSNPMDGFSFLKAKAIRKYTPSAAQVGTIINHIRNKQYFPEKDETADFIEFMALTGQGRAEVEHIIWQDVLWEAERINFYRQKTRAVAHTMPMFPSVKAFLERRWKRSDKDLSVRVFKIKNCRRALKSACVDLKIPKLGHHSFRRFFITQRMIVDNPPCPPNVVAKWVGHQNTDMVMEIYTSIPNDAEIEYAKRIQPIAAKASTSRTRKK